MLSTRLEAMRRGTRDREQREFRQASSPDVLPECEAEGLSWPRRSARLTRRQCEAEKVIIRPDERIVFTRTVPCVPPVYTEDDWEALFSGRTAHELGPISNICADWGMVLAQGLLGRRTTAVSTMKQRMDEPEVVEFLECACETIDAVIELSKRYAAEARRLGRDDLADILGRVPAQPPGSFHEALQSLLILRAVVWLSGHYHVGLGRFDQYMWPYLCADLESARLTEEGAEELLAEFFIALNRDSDLYPGVQQGDNGQSLMLGGVTRDGACAVNPLTWMALRVARDVSLIDPKINLRISRDTDLALLEMATRLTERALGFPQYANDDVVIPALIAHGYDTEDARDYTVAACWEFTIPGKGMEVVNIGAVSLPAAVDNGVRDGIAAGVGFDGILERVRADIQGQVNVLVDRASRILLPPAPYYSVLMDDCIEQGRDISQGAKYNNFGIHGACSANAADALAATNRAVFVDKEIEGAQLLRALRANYEGYEDTRVLLAKKGPKVGNNDTEVDSLLVKLFDYLADACRQHRENGRWGCVRAGTGSAPYYIWLARGHEGMCEPVVGATADGRKAGEFFSSSLAPSPGARVRGPISTLQSFSRLHYDRLPNGGPITMELSDTVFQGEEGLRKVAMLVRTFAQLGCQQLQLNTLNGDTLEEAKEDPEKHKDLIVRVWGWSGYFCELAPEYQDHIIARHKHLV